MPNRTLHPGIPGIDRPFKPVNANFPPNSRLVSLMREPLFQKMAAPDSNVDCSEMAKKLFQRALQGAVVYYAANDFHWPERVSEFSGFFQNEISVPEKRSQGIVVTQYCYHAVYSDGRYIYDPTLSSDPVVKSDYLKLIKSLNPGKISSRYTPDNARFCKGEYSR